MQNGIQWHNVAKAAYEVYAASINDSPSRSEIRVPFEALSDEQKEAWMKAVSYACMLVIDAVMA